MAAPIRFVCGAEFLLKLLHFMHTHKFNKQAEWHGFSRIDLCQFIRENHNSSVKITVCWARAVVGRPTPAG